MEEENQKEILLDLKMQENSIETGALNEPEIQEAETIIMDTEQSRKSVEDIVNHKALRYSPDKTEEEGSFEGDLWTSEIETKQDQNLFESSLSTSPQNVLKLIKQYKGKISELSNNLNDSQILLSKLRNRLKFKEEELYELREDFEIEISYANDRVKSWK